MPGVSFAVLFLLVGVSLAFSCLALFLMVSLLVHFDQFKRQIRADLEKRGKGASVESLRKFSANN